MSHDEPRLQLHAYLKSLSGYRGAPLHVDLCFYVCNPKKHEATPAAVSRLLKSVPKFAKFLIIPYNSLKKHLPRRDGFKSTQNCLKFFKIP